MEVQVFVDYTVYTV